MWHRKLETWWSGTWKFFVVKWRIGGSFTSFRFLLITFYPGVNSFTFNGTEWKKMTNQDGQRLNLIYLENWVHIWAPFFRGPVSPCIHVPVVGHSSTVISSLWLLEYWSNGDLQATWFNDIFWRVMGLSRNLRYDYLSRKNFTLRHSWPLFLGQVISLACWKSIMAGSIFPFLIDFQCSTRLRNLILHDLIGVMQSITARSNSFLHQTNNNLHVIIAVEKATGPPVWGVHKITSKLI